ncbi:TPA: hypothetical protein N0F65_002589 [Lagenidium giganteum]|uniref:Transcription activator GCR1-like domain-containing protein n=1 Tax=Lagenidium giganteum TaxID=4803 RepID=A0AAV2Z2C9_9STRA|nr:TPA: hypothetical protein N0F65_002589 [Lagenidium giganteum]
MSRSIASVTDAWMEWCHGLDGGPSVLSMEAQHQNAWRKDATEKRYFFRRKQLLDVIHAYARTNSVSDDEAAQQLEKQRQM